MNMNDPPPADDQLPIFDEEILWKIFGKWDPKTAGKCRALSNKWRMRLTNPLFAKHNFSENKHRNMQIVAFLASSGRGDECFSMVRVDMQTRQQCQGRLPESIRNFSSFQVIGSSNGLLCIKFILGTAHSELTVWNPLTRRRISTQDHSSKQKDFAVSQYAFGHIFDTLYYALLHVFKEKFADRTVHWSLYSSVTKNWNLKGSFEGTFEKLGPTYVVLKGVVYWIGWQGVAIPKPKCIVSFNLRNRAVVEEEIPQKAKSTFHTLSILKDEVAFISSFYEGQFTIVVDVTKSPALDHLDQSGPKCLGSLL
ncbi:hypothetical protein PIB30_080206 [Stylosanthes scabra]|uniref:F-box associated beta-propeller type 1 domain-containing protein n=1 Tax=Stylosanthes scabra TaxID=79078 RepID=A0ABU6US58_9FABA|nr:hypothetical protein [Stylosanthes scabra]